MGNLQRRSGILIAQKVCEPTWNPTGREYGGFRLTRQFSTESERCAVRFHAGCQYLKFPITALPESALPPFAELSPGGRPLRDSLVIDSMLLPSAEIREAPSR